MKISIITATLNSIKNLPTALSSVVSQNYDNIEWIIVDGNSNDGTVEYIKTHQDTIDHWISEPDLGIYDALNKGIRMATGDVIGLLHSDDVFNDQNTIANVAKSFISNNSDGVYGNLEYVSKHNINKVIRYWKSQNFKPSLLQLGWMPAHPSLFLKKEVYKKHGYFDLTFKIAADYDFILRIFQDQNLKFSYLNQVITKMRTGGASNHSLNNITIKTIEDLKALRKNNIKNPFKVIYFKKISKILQFIK